jgi:hypothetical protein
MSALLEWTKTHTTPLFPLSAEYVQEGGNRVRVEWHNVPAGQQDLRPHGAALQFDQNIVDALYIATPEELARIGTRLCDEVARWLEANAQVAAHGPLVIPIGDNVLEH